MLNIFRKKVIQPPPLPLSRSLFTPDIALLEEYQQKLLFVADEWMKDRRQNFVLNDVGAERKAAAFTYSRFNYRTFMGESHSPQHTQVALRTDDGFRIKGEVVSIRPDHFLTLDKLRLNRIQFERKRTLIIVPYRDGPIVYENTSSERQPRPSFHGGVDWITGKFPNGHPLAGKKCWLGPEKLAYLWVQMYVGIPEYWQRFTKSPFLFNTIPTFIPKKAKWWLTRYYKYQNPKE